MCSGRKVSRSTKIRYSDATGGGEIFAQCFGFRIGRFSGPNVNFLDSDLIYLMEGNAGRFQSE